MDLKIMIGNEENEQKRGSKTGCIVIIDVICYNI